MFFKLKLEVTDKNEVLINSDHDYEILKNLDFNGVLNVGREDLIKYIKQSNKKSLNKISICFEDCERFFKVNFDGDFYYFTDTTDNENQISLISDSNSGKRIGHWEFILEENKLLWTDITYDLHERSREKPVLVEEALLFYLPKYQEIIQSHFKKCIEDQIPYDLELQILTEKKNILWVRTKGYPGTWHGKVIKVQGSFEDINHEVLQRIELKRKSALLESIFNSNPTCLIFANPEREIQYVSDSFKKIFQYYPEEVIGRTTEFLYAIKEDFSVKTAKTFNKEDPAKKMNLYEVEYLRKDGSSFIGETRGSAVHDAEGRLQGFLGLVIDKTEEQANKDKIIEIQNRYETALDVAKVGIWDCDLVSNELIWDDRMFDIFDVSKDSFRDVFDDWSNTLVPEDRDRAIGEFNKALAGESQFDTVFKIRRKNGEIRSIKGIGHVFYDQTGCPVRMLGINQDVTKEKELEVKILEESKRAEIASKAKSTFVANISHEIRTPMNGILGLVYMLKDTNLTREQFDLINALEGSSNNLLKILNDVLDMSKIELGEIDFNFEPVHINSITGAIFDLYNSMATKNGLKLIVDSSQIGDKVFVCDEGKIRQILSNFILNALKFTKEGSVSLLVKEVEKKETFSKLRFSVIDTGPGLDEELKKNVFGAFIQGENAKYSKNVGSGLGLSIAKELADALNGEVGLRSEIGKGSEFYLDIILEESQLDMDGPKNLIELDFNHDARALVVEDNRINAIVFCSMLDKIKINHEVAINGKEALDRIEKGEKYDYIFMDIQMPIMNGFESSLAMRKLGYNHPIIALTANVFREDQQKALEYGMDAFIGKPVRVEQLKEILEKFKTKKAS